MVLRAGPGNLRVMSDKDGTAGGRCGGGRGRGRFPTKKSTYNNAPRAYVSPVLGIEHDTFNTGHSKYTSQFKTSRRNVANFVQQTLHDEGYLVPKTFKTGVDQTVAVPPSIPETTDQASPAEVANARDDNILREGKMAHIGKRITKLDNDTKKGFAILYDQCRDRG